MTTTRNVQSKNLFASLNTVEEYRKTFYGLQNQWIKQKWSDAQSLPMVQRIEEEEKLLETLAERSECRGLDFNALQLICQHGNPPGFAYAHGFTVHWFPSRGVAKHAYYQDLAAIRTNDGRGREALGPAPTPCTLLSALRWGRGFCQAWF